MLTIGAVLLSLLTASAVLAIVVEDSIRSHPHSDAGLSMETMP